MTLLKCLFPLFLLVRTLEIATTSTNHAVSWIYCCVVPWHKVQPAEQLQAAPESQGSGSLCTPGKLLQNLEERKERL